MCACWRRPEAYLVIGVRKAISTFARLGNVGGGLRKLKRDLEIGAWKRKYGDLLAVQNIDLGYRIVVCDMQSPNPYEAPAGRADQSGVA